MLIEIPQINSAFTHNCRYNQENLHFGISHMTEQKTNSDQTANPPAQSVHEIHAQVKYRKYKVIDLENNSIETTAANLVEASKLLNNRDLWVANFKATIEKVREWCRQQNARISLALVDVHSTKMPR